MKHLQKTLISIHAPPRGATFRATSESDLTEFQFTPLREGRHGTKWRCWEKEPFQFTPLREGRHATRRPGRIRLFDFNSRPSARGDSMTLPIVAIMAQFQFTPLREGRPESPACLRNTKNFNSRPSARGDQGKPANCPIDGNFNSRPSARGDHTAGAVGSPPAISIHAPPRGATISTGGKGDAESISIHAPPRGATRLPQGSSGTAGYFNSRPSARGDVEIKIIHNCTFEFQFTPLREGRQ